MKTFSKKNTADETERENLYRELDFLKTELDRYEVLINMSEDNDLIEAYIYEYKGVKLRYGYLIRKARENNITVDFTERCL